MSVSPNSADNSSAAETDHSPSKSSHSARSYRDEKVLRELYWNQGMSQKDIANELDCSDTTIHNYMKRHGIERRDRREAIQNNHASFRTRRDGYEGWNFREGEGRVVVMAHSLLAIANGEDPFDVFGQDGTDVHHRTGIEWLNIPELIEPLPRSEHSRVHAVDEWSLENGYPVLVSSSESADDSDSKGNLSCPN